MTIAADMLTLAREAKQASRIIATLSSQIKDELLQQMAATLEREAARLIAANQKDVLAAQEKGMAAAMIDRLLLDEQRIGAMAAALREVAALPDPVGEVTGMRRRPNGLQVGRMRIPLGVIGIIYESRPNVTADAAGLCLKSGNAVILRGGSESLHSNNAIGAVLKGVLESLGLPAAALQVIATPDRQAVLELLKLEEEIDLIIPRGGEGLIRFVSENSRIPVIKHYKGVCHVFVDASADYEMAERICLNAKVQRPGVCNAMETLLIHKDIAETFVPRIAGVLRQNGVEVRGCPITREFAPEVKAATRDDWGAEYLELTLAVKVVDDLADAVAHIQQYGSLHTEAIVTRDYASAQRFVREVNSSTVLVNASTRFADGNQLGLGAEIGISTTKLHSFGPMGLEDLTPHSSRVMKTGILGGTFNPIHLAHLRIAEEVREACALDRVLFIPAAAPPHKRVAEAIPFAQRLAMVQAAIADHPAFAASDLEARREGKSYSVDTLEILRREHPGDELFFIIGMDSFRDLHLWREYRRLFELAHLVVAARPGVRMEEPLELLPVAIRGEFCYDKALKKLQHCSGTEVIFLEETLLGISSTGIRRLLEEGRSIRYLVPPVVERYIQAHALYQGPERS